MISSLPDPTFSEMCQKKLNDWVIFTNIFLGSGTGTLLITILSILNIAGTEIEFFVISRMREKLHERG